MERKSKNIVYVVPSTPVAKARPRTVGLRNGRVRTYTPAKTANYENHAKKCAMIAMRGQQALEGPVRFTCEIYLPIPKSWPKKKQAAAAAGEVRPISRPDIDNYIKALLDSANEIVVQDDSQVVELVSRKSYSHNPRATLTFEEIKNA